MPVENRITTDINTDVFFAIIKFLKNSDWKLKAEYDELIFDKGIDFDFYQFSKDRETILLAWSNWFEGEIKASSDLLLEFSTNFKFELKFGEPEYLKRVNLMEERNGLIIKKSNLL